MQLQYSLNSPEDGGYLCKESSELNLVFELFYTRRDKHNLTLLNHREAINLTLWPPPIFPVPPKLSPTNPERNLNLGERASLICAVLRGDIPLTIKWLKDGRHIDSTSSALSITQVDEFNSMLVIGSVSARHSGNYSCTVKNQASEETQVTRLLVNGKTRSARSLGNRSSENLLLPLFYCSSNFTYIFSITSDFLFLTTYIFLMFPFYVLFLYLFLNTFFKLFSSWDLYFLITNLRIQQLEAFS